MITSAPAATANCKAKIDTPPVPNKSTLSPAFMPPTSTRARQAVSAAQGRVAAAATSYPTGTGITPAADSTTCSARTPSRAPPRALSIAF